MPRKKDADDWKPDGRGRYRRMVGWREDGGKRVQQPFYLGTDLDQARARYLRVKELWAHLERAHERSLLELNSRFELPERTECRWKTESLWVARELAAGRVQVSVPPPDGLHPSAYVSRIDSLAKSYPMAYFVPEDAEVYGEGKTYWQLVIENQQKKLPLPLANAVPRPSRLLHEALDAYMAHIQKTDLEPTSDGPRLTAFGNLKVEQARRIRSRQADRPLSTLDFHGCQELLDYWRLRPATQARAGKSSRPMAKKTCENHVAEAMRFFRWLHKSPDFAWRKSENLDDLDTRVKDIVDERTGIGFLNVKVYSLDELALLNRYATPLERVLLLLGLNCGFKGAEQGTLRLEHLFLDRPHLHAAMLGEVARFTCGPQDRFILYSRNKSNLAARPGVTPCLQATSVVARPETGSGAIVRGRSFRVARKGRSSRKANGSGGTGVSSHLTCRGQGRAEGGSRFRSGRSDPGDP